MAHAKARDEYASWLAASKKTRLAMGLPQSQKEFARLKGVSARSLQRWKKDPEFQLLVEQRKALQEVPDDTGRPRPYTDARIQRRLEEAVGESRLQEGESPEETEYLQIKDVIVLKAMDGDHRAQEIFMKHWGKPFVEAEASADEELSVLSDVELHGRLLELIGVDAVSAWLASQ